MSHADCYNACWGLAHTLYSANGYNAIVTHCVGTSFTVQCTSHAHYYKACWGHTCTHCIQQTDTMLLLHTVMGQSLRFNAHVACSLTLRASPSGTFLQVKEGCRKPVLGVWCSLLQRVLGTRTHIVFNKRIQCYCYTLWWDSLYGLMHMSHAHYYNAIVTHCDGTVFTVQCTCHMFTHTPSIAFRHLPPGEGRMS